MCVVAPPFHCRELKEENKRKKMFIFFSYLSQAETNQEMEESTPKAFGHLVWGELRYDIM